MAGGIGQKNILVIGCGPVGRNSVFYSLEKNARVSVFDINVNQSNNLVEYIKKITGKSVAVLGPGEFRDGIDNHFDLFIDATNSASLFNETDINSRTFISAPGMPLGLTPAAASKLTERLLHDPLQLGTAVMGVMAVKGD